MRTRRIEEPNMSDYIIKDKEGKVLLKVTHNTGLSRWDIIHNGDVVAFHTMRFMAVTVADRFAVDRGYKKKDGIRLLDI
jgi:hypothetical protein